MDVDILWSAWELDPSSHKKRLITEDTGGPINSLIIAKIASLTLSPNFICRFVSSIQGRQKHPRAGGIASKMGTFSTDVEK